MGQYSNLEVFFWCFMVGGFLIAMALMYYLQTVKNERIRKEKQDSCRLYNTEWSKRLLLCLNRGCDKVLDDGYDPGASDYLKEIHFGIKEVIATKRKHPENYYLFELPELLKSSMNTEMSPGLGAALENFDKEMNNLLSTVYRDVATEYTAVTWDELVSSLNAIKAVVSLHAQFNPRDIYVC